MRECTVCAAPVRPGARFCTSCGAPTSTVEPAPQSAPVFADVPAPQPALVSDVPAPQPALSSAAVEDVTVVSDAAPEPLDDVPSRIPATGRIAVPPARSELATWSLVAGVAPLVISVAGNLIASQLGVAALERVAAGETQGAWAGVLVTLALVFVLNAGLLTVCAIAGVRAIRETGNGVTRGRGLAIAGLAVGSVNLVLWVAGLVVSVNGLDAALS
ncbi:zinc-ribbon domain-containing protein [Microcella sp.]|uniref:zinc-ribbon domain-containing protein n=1 Tax=Microcella sp. TaxID=1913979 RepID=UPI00299F7D24|nr:zinc-ribbon domain-containing protein [Microcella sp.]MDX2025232.1 hypothetical protein [Microcella sp.]